MKYCFSTLILFLLLRKCKSLYDYVCQDPQVYKPHVKAFLNNRNGEEIDLRPIGDSGSAGQNFYIINKNNTYICINGPAYLYYSKTTVLGEVYETPEMQIYDHICDTYNVYPDKGATKRNITRKLHAILLMGDKNNYYKYPALQLFTAPYYDPEGSHYINATSLIVFGKEPCFIEKGGLPVRIDPPPPSDDKERYYCQLGYSHLLKLKSRPDPVDEKWSAKDILSNVQDSIRNGGCSYSGYGQSANSFKKILVNFRKKISGYAKPVNWQVKIDELDKKIQSSSKEAEKKKLEKQKEKYEILKGFEDKIEALLGNDEIKDTKLAEIDGLIKTVEESTTAANDKRQKMLKWDSAMRDEKLKLNREPYKWEEVKAEIERLKGQRDKYEYPTPPGPPPLTTDDQIKDEWAKIGNAIIKVKLVLAELDFYYAERNKKTPRKLDDAKLVEDLLKVPKKVNPFTEIKMESLGEASQCFKMEKTDEFCKAAKPNKEDVCTLFKTSLGYVQDSFTEVDSWKKEVLGLVEDIFNTACFRLNKKFTRNVHRIFKYYLTDSKYFNIITPPPTPPVPVNPGATNPAPTAASSTDANKIERPFWRHIKKALEECKRNKQLLFVSPNTTAHSGWTLKRNNAGPAIDIIHHQEQAELEYSFNYVIDWQFKIFATVLGLCMPAYEAKVPLITSRFYAMYTEDFIIPLRDTWVSSKDNKVFTWILGEHKHHDDDKWVNNCMEASFLQSNKVEYRPPRCVLVNEKSEHNYYISGTFPYGHKGIYANG